MTTALEAWDAQQKQIIKEQIAKGCSDGELRLFAQVCQRTGLDPFSRQIYAIQRSGKMSIQTSIDGFRVVAERSGEYEGQTPKQWCGDDGQWTDVWLKKEHPAAARVGVYRRGFREPLYAVATWAEYAQKSPMWDKMGAHMLAKCAESLALRASFPNDLSGLYTSDEMDGRDEPIRRRRAAADDTQHVRSEEPRALGAASTRGAEPPPPLADPDTGEIIDAEIVDEPKTVLQAGLQATEQRRKFAPPTRRAQPEPVDIEPVADDTLYADAEAVLALQQRVLAVDAFDKDSLRDDWKAAGLPSIANTGAKLTPDELKLADTLVSKYEPKDAA